MNILKLLTWFFRVIPYYNFGYLPKIEKMKLKFNSYLTNINA